MTKIYWRFALWINSKSSTNQLYVVVGKVEEVNSFRFGRLSKILSFFVAFKYIKDMGRFFSRTIPDICHFFLYTSTFQVLKILHSKVHKFATKTVLRQNSINWYFEVKIHIIFTLCVKLHTVCKFTHCV